MQRGEDLGLVCESELSLCRGRPLSDNCSPVDAKKVRNGIVVVFWAEKEAAKVRVGVVLGLEP